MPVVNSLITVNGIAIASVDSNLAHAELRQRACTELLRQAAIAQHLLPADDPLPVEGILTEQASAAIERLLDTELRTTPVDEAACQRYYEANADRFDSGEIVTLKHILFAVTPGVDVAQLRQRAEACLIELRCDALTDPVRFAQVAGELSNCPSGAQGGELGPLRKADCAPEFAREVFGKPDVGVLARLIHSRFGFHVVQVLAREPGSIPAFEQVRGAVSLAMERQGFATALRQYLQVLASDAKLVGVDMDGADGMLVQ